MDVLVKFTHGLGDAVQLTCVLLHLAAYRPDWVVDVASQIGKHTAYAGLCRRSFILGRDPIDEGRYHRVFDLGWYECYSVYCDSPCTKVCNSLREEFGIVPDLALLKYQIAVSDTSHQKTRDYLNAICQARFHGRNGTFLQTTGSVTPKSNGAHAGTNGFPLDSLPFDQTSRGGYRFPVVAIHYQANTSSWKKDLPHTLVAELCQEILSHGYVPLILDWDRRSPLPDQKTIFCPGVGAGDLWENTGTGDAERLAALLSQCALVVGVDSGPLHVAGATDTPTLGVWTGHHPVQFYDLCPNVTHLVPDHWRTIPPCQNAPAARFFANHYAHRTYADLDRALLANALDMLDQNQSESTTPAAAAAKPRKTQRFSFLSPRQEPPMTTTIITPTWVQLPGLAHEVALGADGSAWCLGVGEISPSGYSIHRWNGHDWDHVEGAAVKIAVDPNGQPWVIDRERRISRLTPIGWELLPGLAREVAVGGDGSVWCLSAADIAPGGASIHHWNGTDWDHAEGAAVKISVGPDGEPWIVNSAGQIFRRSGEGWELLPGLAREIACGADGTVWCLGTGEMPGGDGYSIHLWNGFDWDHLPGAAVKLAAGQAGNLWIVHSDHSIFRSS